MTVPMILLPVFVLVAQIFVLSLWMGLERNRAISSREVHIRDVALSKEGWPSRAKQISNAYHNQYELPVLFFILVAFALITRKADLIFVALSWAFVILRIVHMLIHTTSNRVPRRFFAYVGGLLVLIVMWAYFAFQILTGL